MLKKIPENAGDIMTIKSFFLANVNYERDRKIFSQEIKILIFIHLFAKNIKRSYFAKKR